MAITNKSNKQAFTLIELMISILLFSFVILGSIQTYNYLSANSKMNEIRYLVLNKLDSEMSRLVFSYENVNRSNFCSKADDSMFTWQGKFEAVPGASNLTAMRNYNVNPLDIAYGLFIRKESSQKINNIINIYNTDFNDMLSVGSIVGLLAWRVEYDTGDETTATTANLSLSISYPYIVTSVTTDTTDIEPYNNFPIETMNLKTSTGVK
jgi:prepilin-type N-terminal cleavage/methylation domain-containing protein